jgi:hypothetical protein
MLTSCPVVPELGLRDEIAGNVEEAEVFCGVKVNAAALLPIILPVLASLTFIIYCPDGMGWPAVVLFMFQE